MEDIQYLNNLIKQIDFNTLIYYYKSASKNFIEFKGPLNFYKNIKEGYITLEKAEEKQIAFKSSINKI